MRIIVFADRFEGGKWISWEHTCDGEEADAVLDSASAKAFCRSFSHLLTDSDYLEGARYIFGIARGPFDNPAEGDLRVTKVVVSVVAQLEIQQLNDPLLNKKSA